MSLESEKIFGKAKHVMTGPDIAEEFETRLDNAEQLFFSAFGFLQEPVGKFEPHPLLAEISRYALGSMDAIEVVPNQRMVLSAPILHELDEELLQVQVPHDYLEIADRSASDILFHAVWIGSKVRDFNNGWDIEGEDSDARAHILQAEFLFWWDKVAQSLGVIRDWDEGQETVLSLYPDGLQSPQAEPYLGSLGIEGEYFLDSFMPGDISRN